MVAADRLTYGDAVGVRRAEARAIVARIEANAISPDEVDAVANFVALSDVVDAGGAADGNETVASPVARQRAIGKSAARACCLTDGDAVGVRRAIRGAVVARLNRGAGLAGEEAAVTELAAFEGGAVARGAGSFIKGGAVAQTRQGAAGVTGCEADAVQAAEIGSVAEFSRLGDIIAALGAP